MAVLSVVKNQRNMERSYCAKAETAVLSPSKQEKIALKKLKESKKLTMIDICALERVSQRIGIQIEEHRPPVIWNRSIEFSEWKRKAVYLKNKIDKELYDRSTTK